MLFSSVLASLVAAATATAAVVERQSPGIEPVTILSPGSIQAPTDGTVVFARGTVPFKLAVPVPEYNHCHPLYTPVNIYVLADKPTISSLNSTYQFPDYLYYYGEYVVSNIPGKSYAVARVVSPLVTFIRRCRPAAWCLSSP